MSFVRKGNELNTVKRQMFGGQGEVTLMHLLNGHDEMYGKGRVFSHIVLEKGCEVGWHIHKGDGEAFYIIKGQGEYSDNGTKMTVFPGDMLWVDDGEGHSMINLQDEPLEYIALVLYK